MSTDRLLKIRVTLKGRPVRAYAFNKDVITVGRSPESDIFLDNPGISREHVRLTQTSRGSYVAQDSGSANGTLVNDKSISRHELAANDIMQVGKFSLWVTYEEDRRGEGIASKQLAPTADEGTTVLSTSELEEMIGNARRAETSATQASQEPKGYLGTLKAPTRTMKGVVVLIAFLAFAVGSIAGASTVLYLTR